MKILLVQDDEGVRERVAFVLEGQFNATVSQAATPADARSLLKEKAQAFDLVVIDVDRSVHKDADKLRAEITAIQSIVFLRGPKDKPLAISAPPGRPTPVFVDRGDIVQNLITTVGGLLKQAALPSPAPGEDDRDFVKIRTKLLLSVCPLESDIYIRLSESKYLKLMRQGDTFDLGDMEKYTVKKGVEFLYLRKNAIQDFIRKYQAELMGMLQRKPEMGMREVAEANEGVLETLAELGATVGWTPEVQEMAKTQVATAVRSMEKSPRLSSLLKKLEGYNGKYIASHSTMCGYLACAIASQMKWGSEQTFFKLTLASFLHDITLTNHDLAACRTIDEARAGAFTEDEKKAFSKHPIQAAEVAKQFNEVPPDVDVIIIQHHERPDSSGFPRGLGPTYIAPLSAVFIVAHDLTQYAIQQGSGFRIQDFLDATREAYRPSAFRKVVQAIELLEGIGQTA